MGKTRLLLADSSTLHVSSLNDPSAAVVLLMPDNMDDPDVIFEAVKAGQSLYQKTCFR